MRLTRRAAAAAASVVLAVATVLALIAAIGSDEDDRAVTPEGSSLTPCADADPQRLPRPAHLRLEPVAIPPEMRSAAAQGGVVRAIFEDGRRVGTVLSSVLAQQDAPNEMLLAGAEQTLRTGGAQTRRLDLGPFGAVSATLGADGPGQVIAHGRCRIYSIVGSNERSAAGMALALLGAEDSATSRPSARTRE